MAQRAVGTNPDAASVDAPVDVVGWECVVPTDGWRARWQLLFEIGADSRQRARELVLQVRIHITSCSLKHAQIYHACNARVDLCCRLLTEIVHR